MAKVLPLLLKCQNVIKIFYSELQNLIAIRIFAVIKHLKQNRI
ncbi:MAG: hypothetical protein ACJARX_001289 [Psychroserpens sp.]|jgi:hypothetical protein